MSISGSANLPIRNLENAAEEMGAPSVGRWYSRGYLPHFDDSERIQSVTLHLADSLPMDVLHRLEAALKSVPPDQQSQERRRKVEAWADAGYGSCILGKPDAAKAVEEAFLHFDGQRYYMLAWVVMPNHAHLLFQQAEGWNLSTIVASWKKFTARAICDLSPGYPKPVWQEEYWDRYIRDETHLRKVIDYIHQNPVKAGLCKAADEWPWSSASSRSTNRWKRSVENADQEIGAPRSCE